MGTGKLLNKVEVSNKYFENLLGKQHRLSLSGKNTFGTPHLAKKLSNCKLLGWLLYWVSILFPDIVNIKTLISHVHLKRACNLFQTSRLRFSAKDSLEL